MARLFSVHVFIYLLFIIQLTSNSVPCWIWAGFKQFFVLYSIISGQCYEGVGGWEAGRGGMGWGGGVGGGRNPQVIIYATCDIPGDT